MATHHSHPVASPSNLQNSYGPEMATTAEYHGSDGPQAVPVGGLEAAPGQQQPAVPAYSSYAQQAQKNNDYLPESSATAPTANPSKRILGLPLWAIWLLLGLAIVVLGVALGVGLGVGLSQRNSTSSDSSSSSATPSPSSSSISSAAAATTATPTSSGGTTTTSSTTSSSTSAAATDASVLICQNAYLDACTTITVPASSCSKYPLTPPTAHYLEAG